MRISIVLIVLLYINSVGLSQTEQKTVSPPGDSILTGFSQDLSTMNWIGAANKAWNSDNLSAFVNENFHSVVIKSSPNLIRDEQDFTGQVDRLIAGNIFGFGSFQSGYVSDNRQIGLSSVGATQLLGGLLYAAGQDTLLAGAGNKWDRQAGVDNSGFTYTLRGSGAYTPVPGSMLLSSVVVHDEQILPRRNSDKKFGVVYRQIFSPRSLIDFSGAYTSQLRDFYFPTDSVITSLFGVTNNIQERNEGRTNFSTTIFMPVLFFEMRGTASYKQRQIDFTYRYRAPTSSNSLYDTRIRTSDFKIRGDLISSFFTDDTAKISMEHDERSESHSVINLLTANSFSEQEMAIQAELNNLGTTNALSGQVSLHFGETTLEMTGLASLFRYDTPSTLNYDDRDQLTNTLALDLSHRFTPEFSAGFGIEADLIHLVYIKSQRSANNNRNYIYRFFPTVNYIGSRVRSSNRFEVLANYTVYDYEAFSQVHSFSFRQVSFLDSTNIKMTSRLSLFFLTHVKLYTRGELYWSSFSEYPLNYFVDQTFWLTLSYSSGAFTYGAGYKYLSLTQYDYVTATSKQFSSEITNSGPTAFFSARFSRLELRLDGWYQVSRQLLHNQIVYPNFDLTAKYKI